MENKSRKLQKSKTIDEQEDDEDRHREPASKSAKEAVEKAVELFKICDREGKGFINKTDMHTIGREMPDLTSEILDQVFDNLDMDMNGYLSMDEFITGFGTFLGLQLNLSSDDSIDQDQTCKNDAVVGGPQNQFLPIIEINNNNEKNYPIIQPAEESTAKKSPESMMMKMEANFELKPPNSADERRRRKSGQTAPAPATNVAFSRDPVAEEQFYQLMEQIGASDLLPDQSTTKALWLKLHKDEPNLVPHFESFLHSVSRQLKQSHQDVDALENAMQSRNSAHNSEIKRLYDEMELQLRTERQRVLQEEELKLQKLKDDMNRELSRKDSLMRETLFKYQMTESQLDEIKKFRELTELEKERLEKEKEEYEMAKSKQEYELESAKRMLGEQRSQLDVLKRQTMNDSQEKARVVSKLRHNIVTEREELTKELDSLRSANKKLRDESDAMKMNKSPRSSFLDNSLQTSKRGSIIGNYLFTNDPNPEISSLTSPEASHEVEVDDSYYHEKAQTSASQARRLLKSIEEHVPVPVDNSLHKELEMARNCQTKNDVSNDHYKNTSNGPERIFKVVCVGDSGVGKTCFLHRFCRNKFRQTFSATIGVDFQVKSLNIDGRIIALQLWDTAGQERFRSITKQYFRKADGVLLVYDVTSELSFLNMRNWMQSVKEGVEPNCVLCVVGNKLDLCSADESSRVVKYKDGEKLAQEFDALFYETSAKSDDQSIQECMHSLSRRLREKEDEYIEEVLKLEAQNPEQNKKWCCYR